MQNSTVLKIVLTAAVAVGGVVFFVKSTLGNTQEYMMVDELMQGDLARYEGKEIKVHGWVVAGSLKDSQAELQKMAAEGQRGDQTVYRTFVIGKAGKTVRIFHKGPVPNGFNDQSETVATGRLIPKAKATELAQRLHVAIEADTAFVLDATDLQAKCPSKYDGAQVNKKLKYE